jgi:hypothetical protein
MQNHINLYNFYHYGDIFYSRTIINPLVKNGFIVNFYHNLNFGILEDIENCNEFPGYQTPNNSINTWLGQSGLLDENGCSFVAHKNLAKKILETYDIKNLSEEDFLPEIFYDNLSGKESIDNLLSILNKRKLVLICNGDVGSGQSDNIDFYTLINNLSDKYSEFLFVITTPLNLFKENVVFIGEYTKKLPDLLLIGYLSKFCDIIIGRASGPVCYTHTKENLMNPNKTYISFTVREHEGKWYCRSKANQVWSNSTDTNNLINIISNELQNKLS